MKVRALTICQPYASLIVLPDSDPRAKRVENRCWSAWFRGPLLIHAGKSRAWLDPDPDEDLLPAAGLPFGAVVGVAQLTGCERGVRLAGGTMQFSESALTRWSWLATHQHAEGAWCWILERCQALPQAIPFSGAQGLWVPQLDLVEKVIEQLGREWMEQRNGL